MGKLTAALLVEAVLLLALGSQLFGCTMLRTPHVTYISLFREKTLGVELTETGQIKRVDYNTALDPAMQTLAEIAGKAATTP